MPALVDGPSGRTATLVVIAVVAYGLLLPLLAANWLDPARALDLSSMARVIFSMLFVAAGLLLLVRWRLTGAAVSGYAGSGLILYGALPVPMGWATMAILNTADPNVDQLCGALAALMLAGFLVAAVLSPPVNSELHPGRKIGWGFLATVGVMLAVDLGAGGSVLTGTALRFLASAEVLAAAATGLLAAVSIARNRRGRVRWFWGGLSLASLAGAELAGALQYTRPTWMLSASALQLVAGNVALIGAGGDLLANLAAQGNTMVTLRRGLQLVGSHLDRDHERAAIRAHDARSALSAVRMATSTLLRYREHLEVGERTSLEGSLEAELVRLVSLVSQTAPDVAATTPFAVSEAIAQVVDSHRAQGLRVMSQLDTELYSLGHPDDLATVIHALLDNARRHAGGPVTIRTWRRGDQALISVEDRGPGVPNAVREHLFNSRSDGQPTRLPTGGLGLFLAARLIRDIGGTIQLQDREGGGARFLLELPACQLSNAVPQQTRRGLAEVDDRACPA